jgi:hypothetical protein
MTAKLGSCALLGMPGVGQGEALQLQSETQLCRRDKIKIC